MEWIKKQFEWFKSFFSEPDGKGSNKRLLGTLMVVIFVISYMKISIPAKTLTDIPDTWALLIAGIIGLGVLDKMVTNKKNGND